MAKILLNVEVELIQQEIRKLSTLLRKLNLFEITLTLEGQPKKQKLETYIQNQLDLIGSYSVNDPNGALDDQLPVIENLRVLKENVSAITKRIEANEIALSGLANTKADKTTTDALQSDINDLVEAIVSQEVWTGDFSLPLPADNNIVPWSAEITNALNGISAGQKITLKLQNMTGEPVSIFLEESVNDNSFTSESFNGDPDVQVKVTTAQFELNGLMAQMRGDYKLIEIRSIPAEVKVNLSNLATIDLSNVNVGVANAGKLAKVKADGKLEYVAEQDISGKADKTYIDNLIKYEEGRVLSFSKQKTTGAFADRTLFSELVFNRTIEIGGKAPIITTNQYEEIELLSNPTFTFSTDGFDSGNVTTDPGSNILINGNKATKLGFYGEIKNLSVDLNDRTDTTNTNIKYQYTALKDITNGEMEK